LHAVYAPQIQNIFDYYDKKCASIGVSK